MAQKQFSLVEAIRTGFQTTFRHFGFIFLSLLSYGLLLSLISVVFRFFSQYFAHLLRPDMLAMPTFKSVLGLAKSSLEKTIAMIGKMNSFGLMKFLLVPILVFAVFWIVGFLIKTGLGVGLVRISFDLYDTGESRVSRMFSQFRLLGSYIVAGLVSSLLTLCLMLVVAILVSPFYAISKGLAMSLFAVLILLSGSFLGAKMSFFVYLIVDKNLSGIAAIKESFHIITRGNAWKLVGTMLSFVLIGVTIFFLASSLFVLAIALKAFPVAMISLLVLFFLVVILAGMILVPAAYFMWISIYRKLA